MKCPDHPGRELFNLKCPVCQGELLTESELETRLPGSTAQLTPDSKARAKPRQCPQCAVPMFPNRIGKVEAFIERCPQCEALWVERADLKTLELLSKAAARQAAYASMSEAEKKELAEGLAEATKVDTGPDVGVAQAALSVAAGVPMLDRLQGDRFPFLSLAYAALIVALYFLVDVKDLAYVAGSGDLVAAFTSGFAHFSVSHLIGNAAFLAVFGVAAEKQLPRWAFVATVLVLSPATALLQSLDAADGTLIGGASGVLAGLLGASLLLQPKARVTFFVARLERVSLPLWVYGIGWAAMQALFWSLGSSGTGWVAHLSGFALGLGVGWWFRSKA